MEGRLSWAAVGAVLCCVYTTPLQHNTAQHVLCYAVCCIVLRCAALCCAVLCHARNPLAPVVHISSPPCTVMNPPPPTHPTSKTDPYLVHTYGHVLQRKQGAELGKRDGVGGGGQV